MSLKVWLPLNGNLENKGISDVIVTNLNSTPFDNNGKIGKALHQTNDSHGLSIVNYMNTCKSFTQYSMSAWVYLESAAFNHSSTILSTGNWNAGSSQLCFALYNFSNNAYHTLLIPNASSWSTGISLIHPVELNKWYHIAITCNGTKTDAYINGQYEGTYTGNPAITKTSESNNLYVGAATYYSGFTLHGKLNDIRIYDNALSTKEIKEISQGLVLHYPLNNPYIEGTENLLTEYDTSFESYSIGATTLFTNQLGTGSTTEIINDSDGGKALKIFSTGGSNRCYRTKPLNQGITYTISFYYKSNVTNGQSLHTELYGGDYNWQGGSIAYTNVGQWQRLCWTTTPTSDTTLYYFAYVGTNQTAYIKDIQLEVNDHMTPYDKGTRNKLSYISDCSGYGNDGTIVGTLIPQQDAQRYEISTKFNLESYIEHPALPSFNHATYSFWIKEPSFASYGLIYGQKNNPSGGNIPWFAANTEGCNQWTYFGSNSPNYTKVSGSLSTNTWYHFCYVWNNGVAQWYLNGQKNGNSVTYTTRTTIPNGVIGTIGDSYTGTTWGGTPFNGNISDFRIYTTALSEKDILELYRAPVNVDNQQNIHTFELNENSCQNLSTEDIYNNYNGAMHTLSNGIYTITSPVSTSSWGTGLSLKQGLFTIPYGASYCYAVDILVPTQHNIVLDYNNTRSDGGTNWSGNDNDNLSVRTPSTVTVPANIWTTLTFGSANTNANNTDKVGLYDYSGLGLYTVNDSAPTVWYLKNPRWYIISSNNSKINKNGIISTDNFNENIKANISKQHFISSNEFIEK